MSNRAEASLFFEVTTALDKLNAIHKWLSEQGITRLDEEIDVNAPAYIANLVNYDNTDGIGKIEYVFFNVDKNFETLFLLKWDGHV